MIELPFKRPPELNGANESRGSTCSDCVFYRGNAQDVNRGECCAHPPQIAFLAQGPLCIRPVVMVTDPACQFFRNKG